MFSLDKILTISAETYIKPKVNLRKYYKVKEVTLSKTYTGDKLKNVLRDFSEMVPEGTEVIVNKQTTSSPVPQSPIEKRQGQVYVYITGTALIPKKKKG